MMWSPGLGHLGMLPRLAGHVHDSFLGFIKFVIHWGSQVAQASPCPFALAQNNCVMGSVLPRTVPHTQEAQWHHPGVISLTPAAPQSCVTLPSAHGLQHGLFLGACVPPEPGRSG